MSVIYRVLAKRSGPCLHKPHVKIRDAEACADEYRRNTGERVMVVAVQDGRVRPLTDAERLVLGNTR